MSCQPPFDTSLLRIIREPLLKLLTHRIDEPSVPRPVGALAESPGGLLLVVIPNTNHLLQLRERLHLLFYIEQMQPRVIEQQAGHFSLIAPREISYELRLTREEVGLVVTMTPNNWHLSDEIRQAIARLEDIRSEASFVCLLFQRRQNL